jgi:predicted enzyme related to lactoylglutathione lyase
MNNQMSKRATGIVILIILVFISGFMLNKPDEFDRGIIEFGVVVSDLERSLDFYQNVVGMTKVGGFSIDAQFGEESGLTGGEPFDVTILKLIDSPQATQWKLMSFNKQGSHPLPEYIQDDTGVQYVTIMVKSIAPFLERIKANNVKLLGNTPTVLGDGRQFVLIQDPDGTFIELIGGK